MVGGLPLLSFLGTFLINLDGGLSPPSFFFTLLVSTVRGLPPPSFLGTFLINLDGDLPDGLAAGAAGLGLIKNCSAAFSFFA